MWVGIWIFLSGLIVALIAPMVGHAIKLAEFRQAWINELRSDIATYLGIGRKWAKAYEEHENLLNIEAPESEIEAKGDEVASVLIDAHVLMWRIEMRINPLPNEQKEHDDRFLKALKDLTSFEAVQPEKPGASGRWHQLAHNLVDESRALLKREWEVTKKLPPKWLSTLGVGGEDPLIASGRHK